MINPLEVAANLLNAVAIILAARNSVHTWWTGIVGCILFAWVFADARLYADSTLQVFFIITSVIGWRRWLSGATQPELPIRYSEVRVVVPAASVAVAVAGIYAWALQRFTDAAAPLPDSLVLTFSVLGQLLLIGRCVETWWCWIVVNAIAVPLYLSRGLNLTAVLYFGFLINAVWALGRWRVLAREAA